MNTVISKEAVAAAVEEAILYCATHLRPDMQAAIACARDCTQNVREQRVLDTLQENALIAARDNVPLCQDTGTVWVCLEVGEQLTIPGDVFSLVNDAVARAYTAGRLRMSVLQDALFSRINTTNNTPAFCELKLVPGNGVTLHVLLKGGGSDNASRVVMLPPGAGMDGVRKTVLDCVREKAANACPPLVVGVGVGATFDKVASLAKHALLREVDSTAESPEAAAFEEELLTEINSTGIGAAALGGATTAVAVHLETTPCHIAALPVAVNMGCSAMRSASIALVMDGEPVNPQPFKQTPVKTADSACNPSENNNQPATGPRCITLPLSKDDLAALSVGDEVLLSGPVYTMRDAGHARALAHLEETGQLPFGLEGQTLFYAGPTPAAAGRPLGSVGPTTASRMDFATPQLMAAGIVASIGKGKRSAEVTRACINNGGVYFCTIGGAAALLAEHVTESELVGWEDLGTEALRRLQLKDFPVFVAIDTQGRDLYRETEALT